MGSWRRSPAPGALCCLWLLPPDNPPDFPGFLLVEGLSGRRRLGLVLFQLCHCKGDCEGTFGTCSEPLALHGASFGAKGSDVDRARPSRSLVTDILLQLGKAGDQQRAGFGVAGRGAAPCSGRGRSVAQPDAHVRVACGPAGCAARHQAAAGAAMEQGVTSQRATARWARSTDRECSGGGMCGR